MTFVITDTFGTTHRVDADSRAQALSRFSSRNPGVAVMGITEDTAQRAQDTQTEAD